jgi:hypothetical protein
VNVARQRAKHLEPGHIRECGAVGEHRRGEGKYGDEYLHERARYRRPYRRPALISSKCHRLHVRTRRSPSHLGLIHTPLIKELLIKSKAHFVLESGAKQFDEKPLENPVQDKL